MQIKQSLSEIIDGNTINTRLQDWDFVTILANDTYCIVQLTVS